MWLLPVSLANPDDLDYDEGLYEDLLSRKKETLVRLYNLHHEAIDERPIESQAHTTKELGKILASLLEGETRQFLQCHHELSQNDVRTGPAIDYLASHFEIDEEKLDVENRYQLALVLLEEDLHQYLDELSIRSEMLASSPSRTFILDEQLSIDGITERIQDFLHNWNLEAQDPDAILVTTSYRSERLIIMDLHQEVGPRSLETFEHRTDPDQDIPASPQLTEVPYFKLKSISFQIEPRGDETEITFSDPRTQWHNTLDEFFADVFSVDDFLDSLDKKRSEVAIDLEEDIVESVEDAEDPVSYTLDNIEQRREEARERLEALGLPTQREEELEDSIESIEISGTEIIDDQSIETQEFRLIATLRGLFDSVDGIEEGFREMLSQADEDNRALVLTINDRPVQFSDGTWQGLGSGLPERDRRALEIFFNN